LFYVRENGRIQNFHDRGKKSLPGWKKEAGRLVNVGLDCLHLEKSPAFHSLALVEGGEWERRKSWRWQYQGVCCVHPAFQGTLNRHGQLCDEKHLHSDSGRGEDEAHHCFESSGSQKQPAGP
jgi:hypothetical protein